MAESFSIQEAAEKLGVHASTLRRWESEGKLIPKRTHGNQRRYELKDLKPHLARKVILKERKTVAYARVSSHDQKSDLERQKELLSMYCANYGWSFEIISDLGSDMNYSKKGLNKLLEMLLNGELGRLVISHKDRLLRFGAELIFALCEKKDVEIVIINQGAEPSFEEELVQDVLEIITVFSARLYGSRSRKNRKLIEGIKESLDAAGA